MHGATSAIRPQRQKTTIIRVLFLVLAACTPYYIYFLTTWMWDVFGAVGLFFAFAEVRFAPPCLRHRRSPPDYPYSPPPPPPLLKWIIIDHHGSL